MQDRGEKPSLPLPVKSLRNNCLSIPLYGFCGLRMLHRYSTNYPFKLLVFSFKSLKIKILHPFPYDNQTKEKKIIKSISDTNSYHILKDIL